MTNPTLCPTCGIKLAFAPDGRGKVCERCGYRLVEERLLKPAAELARAQRLFRSTARTDAEKETSLRISLQQGIYAARQKERNEAIFHLERILLSGDATDKMRAEAWLWLSEVYEDAANKRECLEQVLVWEPTNGVARRGLALLDGRLRAEEIVDPNQIHQNVPAEPQEVRAEQFVCPNCASRMIYTPDGQELRCEFCGYGQALEKEATRPTPAPHPDDLEQDFAVGLARLSGHVQPIAMRALQCQGCGVEFMLTPEILSVTCPYCNHVYVTETAETQEILPPQAIIPFAISEEQVKEALRHWFKAQGIKRVRLLPIVGIYLPAWTFDLSGEIGWQGLVQRGSDMVPASGSAHVLRDDELVLAQKRPSKHLRRALQQFDLKQLVPYDAAYLADWPAQRYQIPLADASVAARGNVVRQLRQQPGELTNWQLVQNLHLTTSGLIILSYKLILLPLWMVHYELERQTYELIVDGQNGRVFGERHGSLLGKLGSWLRGE